MTDFAVVGQFLDIIKKKTSGVLVITPSGGTIISWLVLLYSYYEPLSA